MPDETLRDAVNRFRTEGDEADIAAAEAAVQEAEAQAAADIAAKEEADEQAAADALAAAAEAVAGEETPVDETPVEEVPSDAPVEEVPVDAPVEEPSAEPIPEEVPVGDELFPWPEEVPTDEVTGDGSGETLPTWEGDVPVEDSPGPDAVILPWEEEFDFPGLDIEDGEEVPVEEEVVCDETCDEYVCGYNKALEDVIAIMDCDRDIQFADKCHVIRKLTKVDEPEEVVEVEPVVEEVVEEAPYTDSEFDYTPTVPEETEFAPEEDFFPAEEDEAVE